MPASYVQNHVQQFEGRVRRGPLNARLRSTPSRIQDSIRELPDGNVSAGRRDAGGSGGVLSGFNITHLLRTTTRGGSSKLQSVGSRPGPQRLCARFATPSIHKAEAITHLQVPVRQSPRDT